MTQRIRCQLLMENCITGRPKATKKMMIKEISVIANSYINLFPTISPSWNNQFVIFISDNRIK